MLRLLGKQLIIAAFLLIGPITASASTTEIGDTKTFEAPADILSEARTALNNGRYYLALTLLDTYMQADPEHSPEIYYYAARAAYGSGFYRRANAFLLSYYEKVETTLYANEAASLKKLVEAALAAIGASDESAFVFAKSQHTIFAYASYARNYPAGEHVQTADDLSFQRATQLNSEIGYNRYLEFWPDGQHATESRLKADNTAIRIALKHNTVEAYRSYLEDYPKGIHRKQAQERMVAQSYFQARADGSISALKHFLVTYPKSLYQVEAETTLKKAEAEAPRRMFTGPVAHIPPGFVAMKLMNKIGADAPPLVRISKAFTATAHEITFAQYDACVKAGGCGPYSPDDAGWGRGKRPVINVNRADIDRFTTWFNTEWQSLGGTGLWRLPSEAEWTYMARGKVGQLEITKSSIKGGSSSCADCDILPGESITFPVGTGKPNSYGLYDMLSNVAEWVADCWHPNINDTPKNGGPFIPEAGTCTEGTIRGISSNAMPAVLARETRAQRPFDTREPSLGFRLVLDVP